MSEFSNLSSTESKSPVDIETLIFLPRLIFSNFLNSVNFSAAKARKGLRYTIFDLFFGK